MRWTAFLLGLVAFSQETTVEQVVLPTDWSPGQAFVLEHVREREEWVGERLDGSQSSRSVVDVEVREKAEDSYVIRWVHREIELPDDAPGGALGERLATLSKGLALDVRTDGVGTPVGLANPDEVLSFYAAAVGEIEALMVEAGASATEIDAVRSGLAPLLEPETIELTATGDFRLFTMGCGGEYAPGERREYSDQLPNPFGGDPLATRAAFTLLEWDPERRRATLGWTQVVDPEAVREMMVAAFREMARQTGQHFAEDVELPRFEITDKAHWVLDLDTGWPIEVLHERATVNEDRKRVDRQKFRLQ